MRPPSRWSERIGRSCIRILGRLRRLFADDEGSASLEFIVGGLLLLVPIVYLVMTLGLVQSASLGVEAAARHAARAISLSTDAEDADRRAALILRDVASEYGIYPSRLSVAVSCADTAGPCPAAGSTLTVTVQATVALPLVPPVLGLEQMVAVPVQAVSVQKASRLWGADS